MQEPERSSSKDIASHQIWSAISDAFVNRVMEGVYIKNSDGDALPKLATELENCEITLTQIGCEANLNALKHI